MKSIEAAMKNLTTVFVVLSGLFCTTNVFAQLSFSPKVDFATGPNPFGVAMSDLDGDGKPDLVVTNEGSNTVSVYRNTSTSGSMTAGSFAVKVDFTTGAQPYGVAIGDLDGDGKPDLVLGNYASNTLSVYRNTSTSGSMTAGSFAAKVDFATGAQPNGVAMGDVDGDGKLDIVIANVNANTVSVYRNTGTSGSMTAGSFAAKVDFTTGSSPMGVAIGDVDGDGKPDIIVPNQSSNTVSVYRNTSTSGSITTGSFAGRVDFTTGTGPYAVAVGDVDGDGKSDIVVINQGSNTVSVFRNTGASGSITTGSFAAKVDFATGATPVSVAIGDLDGDGKPDLASANNAGGTVSVFRNTSTTGSVTSASFDAKVDLPSGTGPTTVRLGDVDGDGGLDVAVTNYGSNTVSVLRNTRLGSICGIKFNDLDGDGVQDPGELGLPNWIITLSYNLAVGPITVIDTTDANGSFCFNSLQGGGTYRVSETNQSGWQQTFPASPGTHTVTLAAGQNIDTLKFGNTQLATLGSICGIKFNDLDGDGVQDLGELGLPNWVIKLSYNNPVGITTLYDTTDANGSYCFTGLRSGGTYTVSEVNQSGWQQTAPSGSGTYTITLGSGQDIDTLKFGNKQLPTLGSICGIKFNDLDGDGVQDPGELGLPNWIINLSYNQATGPVRLMDTTDANGNYCFNNLTAGTYTVSETNQSGWGQTFPAAPGTHTVTLAAGQNIDSLNFGNQLDQCINGTKAWLPLGTGVTNGTNGEVWALAVIGSDLYVGGNFTTAGGNTVNHIAKWNGSSWSALISSSNGVNGINGTVTALAVIGTDLYAGGWFTTAGGIPAENIAKWDGTNWSALGSGLPAAGAINALAAMGNNLYATSYILTPALGGPGNLIAKWDGANWSAFSVMNDYVSSFFVDGTDLYAGGQFTIAGTVPANRIAKWDGTSWSPLASGMNFFIGGTGLQMMAGNLYAGGRFTTAGGTTANFVAQWDGSIWSPFTNGIHNGMNNAVDGLAVIGTDLYASGSFTTAEGVSANSIAKWDGANWSPLGSGMNDGVWRLAVIGNDLYAGGIFTTAGGGSANYIAKWECTPGTSLGSICGVKFNDVNGNGLKEAGELGLPNWIINLSYNQATGPVTLIDTTDANGNYCFNDLQGGGTYTVSETNQTGWQQTGPASPGTYTVMLAAGQNIDSLNFGNRRLLECVAPPDSMMGWWTGDGTANDISGNNNHGTLQGGAAYGSGKVANAFTVMNAADYVTVPDHASLNFGTLNFSIDAWVKTTDVSNVLNIVDKRTGSSSNPVGYSLFIAAGKLAFQMGDGQATMNHSSSAPSISDGNWHLVAVTVDRKSTTGGKLYVDGILFFTFDPTSRPGSITNTAALFIGQRHISSATQFRGQIDEVELFNSVLPADEIFSIFAADSAGKCKPAQSLGSICGVKFNDLNGNGVQDAGELGLPNWIITLSYNLAVGPITVIDTTDARGNFCFNSLRAGTYTVAESSQTGWQQTFPPSPGTHTVTLAAGQNRDSLDFGNKLDPCINGTKTWLPLGSGINGGIFAIAVSGTDLYVVGQFTTAGGVSANNIAKWNGTSWSSLGSGINGTVFAITVGGTDLYAGGQFTTAGGVSANNIAKWNGTSWSSLGSGINGTVFAITVGGTDLYAGGQFTTAGGVSANNIAKWNGTSWSSLGSGINATVVAITISGTDLYAGGAFTTAGGVSANNIAKWNGTTWSALGSGINGTVYATAVIGADLYAGGSFTTAGGASANNIAEWNGATWSALGTGMNSSVRALAGIGTDLHVGGGFGTAGGVPANRMAKWNGTSWSALGSGMNASVYALAVSGTDLYAGGGFTTAGGVNVNYIAKYSCSVPTSVNEDRAGNVLPQQFQLRQNYPNPFNPTTQIAYEIPSEEYVSLRVYNALGEQVAVLVDGQRSAGAYSVTFQATDLPSGMYFYRLIAGEYQQTRKLLLLR